MMYLILYRWRTRRGHSRWRNLDEIEYATRDDAQTVADEAQRYWDTWQFYVVGVPK